MRRIELVGGCPSFYLNDNNDIIEEDYFFDEELDAKFEELFEQNDNNDIEKSRSLLIEKLRAINEKKFIEDMFHKVESSSQGAEENDDKLSNENNLFSKIDGDEKYFTIPNRFGVKTLLFLVKEQADPTKNIAYYSTELLDCVEEKQADNSIVQTFYTKREYFNKYPILLLHIDNTEHCIYVNNGILDHDIIRISKKPLLFTYENVASEEYNSFSTNIQNSISDEEKEFIFPAKISGSLATIIDLEKCKPVLRETYFDEKDKMLKTNIRLQQKQYFVFKVRGDGCFYWKLSNLEIGHKYRCGSGGYPKNCIKAAVYLENDGGSEALYEIAQIFLNDKHYSDETEGKKYLKHAAVQGNSLAWIEYVLRFNYRKKCEDLPVNHDISKNEMFIKAMLLEKGGDLINAFELYFSLADEKYKYANLRLDSDMFFEAEKKELYEHYILSAKNDDGRVEYCIYLLCDDLFFENKEIGFGYLKMAADKGHKFAIYDIAKAYDEGIDVTVDKVKALNYYFSLIEEDEKILIKVSNMLIDGVGCEKKPENDKMAFNLLYHASKNSNNSTIFNNLGWMYEKGCGCDIDYCQAKKLMREPMI